MMICKDIDEYRDAIRAAIDSKWGGNVSSYCDASKFPNSTLGKFLRGDAADLSPIQKRIIEIDMDIKMEDGARAIYPIENGGFGLKLYTNSKPNHLVAVFDWKELYRMARKNSDAGTGVAILKINTAIECEEFGCAASLYMNAKRQEEAK